MSDPAIEIIDWSKEPKGFPEPEEEDEFIKKFVKAHPYPSYKEIETLREEVAKEKGSEFPYLDWWVEYGEVNHEWCKKMYDSCFDVAVCKEMGEKINERGGRQAMYGNYNMLRWFSPCGWNARKYNNPVIQSLPRCVSCSWHGIGGWED